MGFLFLVLYPLRLPPSSRPSCLLSSLTHTSSHTHIKLSGTHTLTHSHSFSLTHTLSLSFSLSLSLSLSFSLTQSLTHSLSLVLTLILILTLILTLSLTLILTLTLTLFLTVTLTLSLTLSFTLFLTLTLTLSLTHSLFLLRVRRGTWCSARGRMYALASVRCPLVSAALPVAFVWQGRDLVHCQGVGCMPWRPSGVPWSPPLCRWLLRGRRGTWCSARGRMYALASVRCPLVSAALPVAFAWQARDLVHCQGVGCMPWRPSGVPWSPPLCRWLLRGRRGTWCSARGRMYALASLRCPLVSAALPQAWDNVHCQGVGCTPWRPSGVPYPEPPKVLK